MRVQVKPSEQYRLLMEQLPSTDRVALRWHARTIAAQPGLGLLRRKSDDGAVYDYRVKGLVIKYWQLAPDLVELDYVLDLGGDLPPDILAEFQLLD